MRASSTARAVENRRIDTLKVSLETCYLLERLRRYGQRP
jgi:hypothetical protein